MSNSLTLTSIIDRWGKLNTTQFGKRGQNIHPKNRVGAITSLVKEAKNNGHGFEDILRFSSRIVDYCVPEDKSLRSSAWVYVSLIDLLEVLQENYFLGAGFDSKNYLRLNLKNVCKKLGIKYEDSSKGSENLVRRSEVTPDSLILSKEESVPLPKPVVNKVQIMDSMLSMLNNKYTVEQTRETVDFESPVSEEMMNLFGIDENGDLV